MDRTENLTFKSSDERKPPIHMKQRSAGVFHIPDKIWKTSAFAAVPFSLKTSSKCVVTFPTTVWSSVSLACELTAALSSFICLFCSSIHRAYSTSNARAPGKWCNQFRQSQKRDILKQPSRGLESHSYLLHGTDLLKSRLNHSTIKYQILNQPILHCITCQIENIIPLLKTAYISRTDGRRTRPVVVLAEPLVQVGSTSDDYFPAVVHRPAT